MPQKSKRTKPTLTEHTILGIRVDHYDVRTGASINHHVEQPKYAIGELRDDEPVYEYVTHLKIAGTSTYPEERANEHYELTIYGNDSPGREVHLTLRDVQARDKYNSPQFRDYRGGSIPVVKPIPSFALLNKDREGRWTTWLNCAPRLVSDMLVLLATGRPLFLALLESKQQRVRWLRRVELQTTDPASE